MNNYQATIYSQYSNSPVIQALLAAFNAEMDPQVNINGFYNLMWNVSTAQGYGLDVWGRIVGVTRYVQLATVNFFGFQEQAGSNPFGQQSFYLGTAGGTTYALTDAAFLVLILAKALANISNCSIATYNTILRELFPGEGNAYVSDTGAMTERLTFEFALTPVQLAILKQSGAIQAPTGVGFTIMQVAVPFTFGFAEAGYSAQSFNNGAFFAGFS